MIGETISHYKILEKLGQGGMGVVYKALDTALNRMVALKFLPEVIAGEAEEKARFIREARAAAALDHPNIATVYEIAEAGEKLFIAMAYVEGETLKKQMASGKWQVKDAVDIAIQIAEGLKEAHDKGVIHRDIKSANVMVTPKGQVKITDFGLAKLKGEKTLTKSGAPMGTASYMSPEQIRGESIDQRSDIFSFGVLLYEMLTGRLPFQREDDQAVMFAILYDTPSPLGTVRPEIPSELEAVVEKALEKEKEKRHQSVDELLAELQELQRKMAAGEARPFSGRKKLKWRRQAKTARHRGAFLYGSMAILYKRKLTSLLSLQEELAQEITAKLRLKLTGEEKKRLAERYTENVEAYQLYLKGRYFWNQYEVEGGEKAIACFQQAIAIDSAYALAYAGLADAYLLYWGLGLVYIHKGMYEEAISTLQKAKTLLNERHGCVAAQGYAYAQLGNRSQALNCLQELQEMANKDYVPPFLFATLYAGLDEKDKVLEYLEKAYEDRNWQLSILKVEPIFNPLRSEPRFIAIMKKVGLE